MPTSPKKSDGDRSKGAGGRGLMTGWYPHRLNAGSPVGGDRFPEDRISGVDGFLTSPPPGWAVMPATVMSFAKAASSAGGLRRLGASAEHSPGLRSGGGRATATRPSRGE